MASAIYLEIWSLSTTTISPFAIWFLSYGYHQRASLLPRIWLISLASSVRIPPAIARPAQQQWMSIQSQRVSSSSSRDDGQEMNWQSSPRRWLLLLSSGGSGGRSEQTWKNWLSSAPIKAIRIKQLAIGHLIPALALWFWRPACSSSAADTGRRRLLVLWWERTKKKNPRWCGENLVKQAAMPQQMRQRHQFADNHIKWH